MDFSAFRGIRCIGVSKDRELLAQLFVSETGAARWYRALCNPQTHKLEFHVYPVRPALRSESRPLASLDVFSVVSGRMQSTHIKIKRVGAARVVLSLVRPRPYVAAGITRHETFDYDMLGTYVCGPSQTFVHEEYREWTLSVNDQSQYLLCRNNKLIGAEVLPAAPRRICETATVSEIVPLLKGRSQQFAAQALLSLLKMKSVFGCWQHALPATDALRADSKTGIRRKRIVFSGAAVKEFEVEGPRKLKARRICDRGMRGDLADRPKWDALHLRKKDALARLSGTCAGSFVIYRAPQDVCCLTLVLPGGKMHEMLIHIVRGSHKECFELKCKSGALRYRSLGALFEPLYKCDQTVLPIPLVRMDYEGAE